MSQSSKGRDEILITNVNADIKRELKLIAKSEHTTVSNLVRPKLREIVNKYANLPKD